MTREEAITWLIQPTVTSTKVSASKAKEQEAYDMAIEALQVEPTKAVCDDCIWHVCNYNKVDWDGEEGYISRKDVLDKAILVPIAKVVPEDKVIYRRVVFIEDIESLPSADRPTGDWVRLEREENVYDLHGVPTWGINYMCDKCGFITTAIQGHFGQYKFCPNCGANMRGENHD